MTTMTPEEQKRIFSNNLNEYISRSGKQVEQLASNNRDIIINNSASSSASSAASSGTPYIKRKMPWYLSWFWILILGACSGGIYWIVGIIMRSNWKSHN